MIHQARPVQHFTVEYLEQCKQLSPQQIVQFLEEFRLMIATQDNHKKKGNKYD